MLSTLSDYVVQQWTGGRQVIIMAQHPLLGVMGSGDHHQQYFYDDFYRTDAIKTTAKN